MLSRHYEAYVLNDEKGEVEKKKVDSLKIGGFPDIFEPGR